jgi:uncharacterized Zn finger protein
MLLAIIEQQPSLAIELSTGILPSVLLAHLDTAKIQLLPSRWQDLKSDCSCPDFANPCKHLAAVYYILANEIDKNPFILFELKGVVLPELTKGLSIQMVGATPKHSPTLSQFVPVKQLEVSRIKTLPGSLQFIFPLRNMRLLLSLILDNPPFYPQGNFKTFLEILYQKVPKTIAPGIFFSLKFRATIQNTWLWN